MLVVGLTGGIGSGKSRAARYFAELGAEIIDADVVAREVVDRGSTALRQIAEHFGVEVIDQNGNLNRAKLREIIFDNEQERHWLENLLHPLIATQIKKQLDNIKGPYAVFVSPLLLETNQHSLVDRILVIDVPDDLQVQRAVVRDNNSETQIRSIMATQISREERLKQADDVIVNDKEPEYLAEQVKQLHARYLSLSSND